MTFLRKQLNLYWTNIIGKKSNFSLEARIFHAITMLAIVTAMLNMAVNFSIGLIFYGLIIIPLIGVLVLGYWCSRFKNKLHIAVPIFAVAFNLLCGATYFASEGANSVNLFTFILIIFLLSFLTSKKQFKLWIPLTIIHVISLFVIEYFYPDLVTPLYSSKRNRLIDVAQTWLEVAGMIALITMYIQNNYNQEKELAKSRLIALEEINETKNKLFSIVAHDLRAPLASIENYLSIITKIDLIPEEKKSMEQMLLASTKQTSEMLQNILTWSKDQMLGIKAQLSPLNLLETLDNTLRLQQTLAQEKNIALNYSIDPGLEIIADPDMIQLIIRNLLNNAIKFSSPSGTIRLLTTEEKNTCTIMIKDEGIGITPVPGVDVFSVKYQGTYGTNNEKGVGLGLMLAKNYTELQNGEIWYENNALIGTTFYLRLPLQQRT